MSGFKITLTKTGGFPEFPSADGSFCEGEDIITFENGIISRIYTCRKNKNDDSRVVHYEKRSHLQLMDMDQITTMLKVLAANTTRFYSNRGSSSPDDQNILLEWAILNQKGAISGFRYDLGFGTEIQSILGYLDSLVHNYLTKELQ